MKKIACYLSVIALVSVLGSCKKDGVEIHDLSLKGDSYVITNFPSYNITVLGGNSDYTVTSSDESVAKASWQPPYEEGFGYITLYPAKAGPVTITVVDNVTGQQAKVEIKVVNSYMNITPSYYGANIDIPNATDKDKIMDDAMGSSPFRDDHIYTLISNESHALRIYASPKDYGDNKALYTGTYHFENVGTEYYVYFRYEKGGVPVEEKYELDDDYSGSGLLDVMKYKLSRIFGLDWLDVESRSTMPRQMVLLLLSDLTQHYQKTYPGLNSALVAYRSIPVIPSVPDLPLEILE